MFNIDINWLKQKLLELPEKIMTERNKLIDLEEVRLQKENEYNHQYAIALLEAKSKGYNDATSKIVAADNIRDTALDLARADVSVSRQKVVVDNLENRFTAVRKLANLMESEIKNLGG